MKIGLDLTVIQTPHRMRGIGATAINFVSSLSDEAKSSHTFVLYLYEAGRDEAMKIIDLTGVTYELRTLKEPLPFQVVLPGKLRIMASALNYLRSLYVNRRGDMRQADLHDVDYYLQFDQTQPLPKQAGLTTATVIYDLIPYVMEADYLWSYATARQNGLRRKSAFRRSLLRKRYLNQVRAVAAAADRLFAISEHTKQDYVRYAGIDPEKIDVVHLGVPKLDRIKAGRQPEFTQYLSNSWGAFRRPFDINEKPFLLFIGGADPRRRLTDLATAYNMLRARGMDIRLVLAGDTMKGPGAMPSAQAQHYFSTSSYKEDIAFLGFVTNEQRDWLYENALAMVYPSVYEGFGLPVLEAMQYGSPVITYDNSSIREIAGDAALYASNAITIRELVQRLSAEPELRKEFAEKGQQQAQLFSWTATTEQILKRLLA